MFVPTFNLNGDKVAAIKVISTSSFNRRFVSKNVCHTIVYDSEIHKRICCVAPGNRADELLREGMGIYLSYHDSKKFHDPLAAVCHLHPEIAKWEYGGAICEKGKWGWITSGGDDQIIVDVDRDAFWEQVAFPSG